MTASVTGDGSGVSEYWRGHRDRLFLASCIALITTAMSFAIRSDIMKATDLGVHFKLTEEQLGLIAQPAFWGFTLAMVIGGPLCDFLGLGRIVALAFIGHAVGIILTIFATGFWPLYIGTLAIGLGNGFVEAACNPLIATLYPDEKIRRLNLFHVWFPGGIVIGGLVSYGIGTMGLGGQEHGWQLKMAAMLIPLAVYGFMLFGQKYPATERVAAGISTGAMFKECLRPFFLLFACCMALTAITELGPGQWMGNILTVTTGSAGILFLVWENGLMAVGRTFAGPIVHRLSPAGILLASACFSVVGLYGLSIAHNAQTAWVAVTIFAVGVCFFWPTMLGNVNDRFPKTGSLGLAVMGGIGNLAVTYIMPVIGGKYDQVAAATAHLTTDQYKAAAAAGKVPLTALAAGGSAGLQQLVILPVILIFVFGAIFLYDRATGGYRKETLVQEYEEPEATPL